VGLDVFGDHSDHVSDLAAEPLFPAERDDRDGDLGGRMGPVYPAGRVDDAPTNALMKIIKAKR
jgi:hypothetical protein